MTFLCTKLICFLSEIYVLFIPASQYFSLATTSGSSERCMTQFIMSEHSVKVYLAIQGFGKCRKLSPVQRATELPSEQNPETLKNSNKKWFVVEFKRKDKVNSFDDAYFPATSVISVLTLSRGHSGAL